MMNTFCLQSARNMANDQLLVALREGLGASADGTARAAISVAVLEERGVELPMLPEVYRYARDIAEGNLSAHAALILARFPFAVKAVLPLPFSMQDEIADGRKVRVAVKKDGRIMSQEMTIFEMSQLQMRLTFSDEGITPWEQQGEFLHKASGEALAKMAGYTKPTAPKITVDAETKKIRIGRASVSVDDLLPALAALGYVVKPAYGKTLTPVKVK